MKLPFLHSTETSVVGLGLLLERPKGSGDRKEQFIPVGDSGSQRKVVLEQGMGGESQAHGKDNPSCPVAQAGSPSLAGASIRVSQE